MNQLRGKIAFVTGGSRGIGRVICLELASMGARVAFLYKSHDKAAKEVTDRLSQASGESLCFKGDVRDRDLLSRSFQRVLDQWGPVDVLVNNAGINKPCDFDKLTDEDWDEVLGVNLKGPFICSQVALPFMEDGGSIVNISSVSGQYGGPRTAHYAASKAGLISLSQVIARFGAARKIRCNTVAAGLIRSEMADAGLASPAVKQAAESIPLKTLGTPGDVARAVGFLASDDSNYITAQTINVNGGLYF